MSSGDYLYSDGNEFGNWLQGHEGRDHIDGRGGDDYIYGYGGNDILKGGSGHDQLTGGRGNDLLFGGSGNDTLTGWYDSSNINASYTTEVDYLEGGAGADTFVLGNSTLAFYSNHDGFAIIGDFQTVFEGYEDKLIMHGSIDDYSFHYGDWLGGNTTDTAIVYQGSLIAVLMDTSIGGSYIYGSTTFV